MRRSIFVGTLGGARFNVHWSFAVVYAVALLDTLLMLDWPLPHPWFGRIPMEGHARIWTVFWG